MQRNLSDFTESTDESDESDTWTPGFEAFGPTFDVGAHYLAPEEFELGKTQFETRTGEVIDRREIPDSGLSLSDITDWPSHGRETDRPDRIEEWAAIASTVDPRQDDHARSTPRAVADGGVATADFDSLGEIGRGAVLALDKMSGEFLVVDRKEVPAGTVQALDVVGEDGQEYRLNVVTLGETYFDVERGHETQAIKNVANIDDVRDFEVLRRDQGWLEEYLVEKYPHFEA